ncbi:dimethyladenosine transferase 2, mitochondrial-like [Anneissia japonica]|uniref:dimethyladenosine transferase 2, mitochondrial-like n=1 Tax=Anneissia japonica TaxID=1529436 RepID=UPI0014257883|nr:dimethyladenosine transferase 2, mitochondrial-like [Anneissia japonica]XP_033125881.1 dimethyladenosine transferase 2, mitochondrial-like [Anneissia japonica]XP_033125882.1 dimethyladenosine transferase 2, mitochondrial-like [Anneissia japonica]XP_033125883.1 dimethyladenosine transferase 2, mitochondrial-like [Anneissia japonica]
MILCSTCTHHWFRGFQLLRCLNRLHLLQIQQLSSYSTTSAQQGVKAGITPAIVQKIHPKGISSYENLTSSGRCSAPLTAPFHHVLCLGSRTMNTLNLCQNLVRWPQYYGCCRSYVSSAYKDDSEVVNLRKKCRSLRQQNCKYILKTEFARTMREKIWPGDSLKHDNSQILEINAGAGVLTRHLLEGGVNNLIAIEKEPELYPVLNQLEAEEGKGYQVVTGDSFTVLRTLKSFKDANTDLSTIFEQKLGFKNWHREPVIKVIGSIALKTERTNLYIISSLVLQKLGVFKFGPAEFNILMFQKTLETLTQGPTSNMSKYQAISVLMQIGFNIECLHTVGQSSIVLQEKFTKVDNICLVKLTPRMELITENGLSAEEASLFIYFVRNLMTKRKQNLLQILEVWAPGSGYVLIDLGYNKHTRTGDVKAMDYLRMFTHILHLDSFNGHWIGEEIMDHSALTDDIENSLLQDMY